MIGDNILTLGCDYQTVDGGIAAVENVYSSFYGNFHFIATQKTGNTLIKHLTLIKAVIIFIFYMLFKPKIKIIHIHGASYNSFWRKTLFVLLGKLFFRKVIYHVHGGGFVGFTKTRPKLIRFIIHRCDAIIAISEYWKSFFENQMKCKRVELIENVIPEPKVNHKPTSCFTMLFLGKITEEKGIYDLLDVIAANRSRWNGMLRLTIGGSGEEDKLRKIIEDNDLAGMVDFVGWIGDEQKPVYLNNSDCLILPSYVEGMPITIVEAMSYGLTIITTPVGGIPEVVTHGENGLLFKPGNKTELEKCLDTMIDLYSKKNLPILGSEKIVERHLPVYVEKQLETLYNTL